MTSQHVRGASEATARAFSFLVDDRGYRRDRTSFEHSGFALRYRGSSLGVLVDWYPRDPLTVWLVRLVDGELPPRRPILDANTQINYFDLGDLESLYDVPRPGDPLRYYNLPDEPTARILADNLRVCGARLLAGDLGELSALAERVRGRTRAEMVRLFGPDGAKQRGW